MKTTKILPLALGIVLGVAACQNTNDHEGEMTDSTSHGAQMMDSVQAIPPAAGMGISTGEEAGQTSTSANDSIVRMGGGATSRGDTLR